MKLFFQRKWLFWNDFSKCFDRSLTTSVDSFSGGAGNDTISGLLGSSATYTVGDNITGGSGTDTLNLIAASGSDGDGGLVTLNGIETVNVRLLTTAYASAGDQISLNAAEWTGVTTLSNASSLANTQLDVSGLTDDTTIVLNGNTDINVAFNNTATGATANAVLVNAGSAGTATTIASASATNTANFDFDLENTGFVTNVNLEVRGTLNLARIEAGSNVTTYTVTGTGNAALVTDDTITSFDASAAAGAIDITLSGVSNVVVKGGAGADTLRLGTTISDSDSFNGGSGADTIVFTQGAFGRSLNTTNVETAAITFSVADSGAVNASGSTVTTYDVYAGAASADATINSIANAATVNLTVTAAGLDTVTLDAVSGAASMTINVGTAGGAGGVDGLVVSDVAAVTINATTGTAGSFTISTSTFDADVKSITVNTLAGESDLTIADFNAAGVTALSINANGSAGIAFTSGIDGAALVTLTAIASGEGADISFDTIGTSASALATTNLTFDGRASAAITMGAISLGNGATAAAAGTIVMNANNASVGASAADITTTGAYSLTLSLNAAASGTVLLGDIFMLPGTAATAASTAISLIVSPVTVGAAGRVAIDAIGMTGATAGAQITFGEIVLGTSAGFAVSGIDAGTASTGVADVDVSNISITLGVDSSATFATILTTGGAVGAITINGADSASASFAAINASSIGAVTVTVAGDAEADFAGLTAVSNIGAISLVISDEADVTIAAISAGGDIGNITIGNGASGTANFDTIDASSIGSVTISGAGFVDFGAFTATRVGTVDATQMTSGSFTINLSGITNAAEIKLGQATNTVNSGIGNDQFTLLAGRTAYAGNDTIIYSTGTDGTDIIEGFIKGAAASGGDVIAFGTGLLVMNGSATKTDSTTLLLTTASANGAISVAGSAAALAHVVIITSTAFASTAAFASAIGSGGSLEIGAGTGESTAGSIVVVWTDGLDSYVTLATAAAGKSGTDAIITGTLNTVATLTGVTPGALVAANFDFT